MTEFPFHSKITHALCEFWFQPDETWNCVTEQGIVRTLQADQNQIQATEPYLWVEKNFLRVTRPTPDCDWPDFCAIVLYALGVYCEVLTPHLVQNAYLHYEIALTEMPGFGTFLLETLSEQDVCVETPGCFLKLKASPVISKKSGTSSLTFQVGCLVLRPDKSVLTKPGDWLSQIHREIEYAFQSIFQEEQLPLNVRRREN